MIERNNIVTLHRPHVENKLQIMIHFLFINDDWEEDGEEKKRESVLPLESKKTNAGRTMKKEKCTLYPLSSSQYPYNLIGIQEVPMQRPYLRRNHLHHHHIGCS